MHILQIVLIILIIISLIAGLILFLRKAVTKKLSKQQELINEHKISTSMFIIDKKKEKITENTFPKAVYEQIPKVFRFKKFPLVKAKIGPQIVTLICEEKLFKQIPTNKIIKGSIAGIYLVAVGIKHSAK